MRGTSCVAMAALIAAGAVLGYVAALGNVNPFSHAAASAKVVSEPVATSAAKGEPRPACCAEPDIKALVLARADGKAAASDKKPNILVIFGDDIGQTNVSAYSMGVMGYRTPSIDRIAREGMIFTDYYAEQSCTAGRSSFITGQCTLRTGLSKVGVPAAPVGLRKEDPTIAELLKRHRAVRQEPPRRQKRVPSDRSWVR
jgi:hypothetical protein